MALFKMHHLHPSRPPKIIKIVFSYLFSSVGSFFWDCIDYTSFRTSPTVFFEHFKCQWLLLFCFFVVATIPFFHFLRSGVKVNLPHLMAMWCSALDWGRSSTMVHVPHFCGLNCLLCSKQMATACIVSKHAEFASWLAVGKALDRI